MERIGLIDVDGYNFPNIPLMKLSAHHKRKKDIVEWYNPLMAWKEPYDTVYVSKVFSFTPDYPHPINANRIIRGGSGYCIETVNGVELYRKEKDRQLPRDIEHIYPDYSIYPELTKDTAFGFLSRGCPRGCGFCHVKDKEGMIARKVADLSEFWKGQNNIVICDPNILACRERLDLLNQLKESGAKININQGLDFRLIDEEILDILKDIRLEKIHFALDRYEDKELFFEKGKLIKERCGYDRHKGGCLVYILVNYNTTLKQDLERIEVCRKLNWNPYPMIYNQKECNIVYKKLKRWCRTQIFWTVENFKDYFNYE